ncbi:hypothetical protein CIB48_g3465 [Xylaria polymorpha]|nr:hypothetical protein CIB48_g3465 [Xylaria polymorpha]
MSCKLASNVQYQPRLRHQVSAEQIEPSERSEPGDIGLIQHEHFGEREPDPVERAQGRRRGTATRPREFYQFKSINQSTYLCWKLQTKPLIFFSLSKKDEFFLLCDPHHLSHKTLPQPPETEREPASVDAARKHFKLPEALEPVIGPAGPVVKVYEVVDDLPNPRVEQPRRQQGGETRWSVREKNENGDDGEGSLELVEDVLISCSRLVMGIVKGQVENNWRGIHKQIIDKLVKDATAGSALPPTE